MFLLDTGATSIAFVDVAMACHVCKVLQILFLPLAKPKLIRGFDGRLAPDITHVIYLTLTVQGHLKLLMSMLVTKLGQHSLILDKLWMQKHGLIIDMSCDKITFWPGHCQHSTVETELQRIALAPSQSEPMRGREEVLVQKSGKNMLFSLSKKHFKEISAVQDIPHTNFGVTKSKEGVTLGMKILKKKPNAKTKQKKTASTKKLPELLLHVLPNTCGYQCVSKKTEEPPAKYIVPQKQAKAPLAVLSPAPSKVSQSKKKLLYLAMISAAQF